MSNSFSWKYSEKSSREKESDREPSNSNHRRGGHRGQSSSASSASEDQLQKIRRDLGELRAENRKFKSEATESSTISECSEDKAVPESPEKATLLTVTFVVVVFSVVVQGLTISRVIRRALPASAPAETDQPPVSQTDKA